MATNSPQDDWHKTGLRLPRPLHQSLHDAAAASGRSYNGEIVHRLEQSFAGLGPDDASGLLGDVLREVQELKQMHLQLLKAPSKTAKS